jgi:hypothetical protein
MPGLLLYGKEQKMTVQKDVTKNIYVGNGSTRTFPFTFECPAEHPEYIKVYLMQDDGTALATSDYQLDMDARQITYPSSGTALPEGKKLVIMRELPLQQMMNLVNNGPYFAEDVETAFDENVMAMQQIAEKLNRSIIMSVDIDGDAFVNEVPFEAGKSFRIADDGKSIVLTEDPARVLPLAQEAYAQAQAQAQSASASAAAAAQSEDSAFESAGVAGNSAQYASASAASAAENARLAEGYKTAAETAKSNASLYAANAKTSADNATASKEAAQSAATTASNFASAARNSAGEAKTYKDNAKTYKDNAKTYKDNAKTYMDNAKNYSENVNVFVPSVSSAGVLSWTNKAGLTNPTSVNIKGAKGDTGTAASIKIGSVTTGAAGSNASVTNSGTASNVVLDFILPRGKDGADGGIVVDTELSDTSTNPVQNKVVKMNMDTLYNGVMTKLGVFGSKIPTKVSTLENDAGYLTQHQSLDDYAKKNTANTWSAQQSFKQVLLGAERYLSPVVSGSSNTPQMPVMHYIATGAFTLSLLKIVASLEVRNSTVFTAYIESSADYPLSITDAGTLKYIGSASDVAITSAGLLLNILITKDTNDNVTSIVQASKLS